MKLLVVEDDRETASYLHKGLSESGYVVDRAGDGREGDVGEGEYFHESRLARLRAVG